MDLAPDRMLMHYRLVEKIGEGGMGVVWKALDTELNRHVALKILPDELTRSEERRLRFRREAQAAAALAHPNIAVIYQVGEHDGAPFIAMELIQGVSLRDRLASGPLDARSWLKVAIPVAEGLAHAHRNGVVHRDLKPDNVMITPEGQVKILDFGLAKLLAEGPGAGNVEASGDSRLRTISRELTRAGKVFGTVAYMSPEQARGEAVDPRTDLFSFGVMLYEMASGHLPFKARSDVETLGAIIGAEPRQLSEVAPDSLPEAVRIVRKALQKEPGERYQHAEDLVADLRGLRRDLDSGQASRPASAAPGVTTGGHIAAAPGRSRGRRLLGAAVLAIAVAVAAYYAWHREERGAPPGAGEMVRSVAVLPFESTAGDEDVAYLGDGITESVINSLSKISSLRVVPRSIVFAYKGAGVNPRLIGEELGVSAIVTGHVARRGDALVIGAELMDVASVSQIWGEQYSRRKTDIFAVQEEITREIARNLEIRLSPEEERLLARRPTDDPEAYEAYLRGQGLAVFYTEDELESARKHFRRALEIDPNYALALSGLATVESMLYRNVKADPNGLERARGYAERALSIEPDLARAHAALGELYGVQYQYAEAVPRFREAIRLDPKEPSYHDNLSWVLAYLTPPRSEEAEREAREAIRLSPRFSSAYYHLGRALLGQGRIDEAAEAFEYSKEVAREASMGDIGMGQMHLARGEYEKAIQDFDSGDKTPLNEVYKAAALAGLGRKEDAMRLLEKALAGGYRDAPFLEATPWFETLRSDPRFGTILEGARRR